MSTLPIAPVGSVAFLGNYPPRQCGISTFTHDIRNAIAERYSQTYCPVFAMNDHGKPYEYPDAVVFEIEQDEPASYLRAADYINLNNLDVTCIQHEYGIYGGELGSNVLDFAREVRAPIVTTLHTVLERPSPEQNRVLRDVISHSSRVIVMSEHARSLLSSTYDVPDDMVDVIPHGIPDMPFMDTSFFKDKIGVEGKFVLLTFGLLSSNKGIENVIDAMPAILQEFPDVVYVVLGATHPNVLRTDGEVYRRNLERRVQELGLEQSVLFHDRYVHIEELKEYISASDMYITPYLNSTQITSGTLAYSFGCGKAVISTPYLHAKELLADNRGVLVPFADPEAISLAVLDLLRNDARRHAMRKRAYLLGREMIWSEVAAQYMACFNKARNARSRAISRPIPGMDVIDASRSLPPIRLDHLRRMTDSTGLIQHARYALPHYTEGYCSDDNARALAFTVSLSSLPAPEQSTRIRELATRYAAFLSAAFNPLIRQFRNFMSYDRRWLDERGSDDCQGRCVLALGTCIEKARDANMRQWAGELFPLSAPAILDASSPRSWANALLGIDAYLSAFNGDRRIMMVADELESRLLSLYNTAQSATWPWFEQVLSYDNALLPHALIVRGQSRSDSNMLNIGLQALRWLDSIQTSASGCFTPIGSNGFYQEGGHRATFDQQPIEAAGMAAAALAAYRASSDVKWLEAARTAFEWFMGRNDVQLAVYDQQTGGCHDGLSVDRVNKNQGAESTLAYLSARTQMEEIERIQPSIRASTNTSKKRETLEAIGQPLGGILGRRAPSGAPSLNP